MSQACHGIRFLPISITRMVSIYPRITPITLIISIVEQVMKKLEAVEKSLQVFYVDLYEDLKFV